MTAAAKANGHDQRNLLLVTAGDRAEDIEFFDRHPERNYRIGSRWIVRRRRDVLLRTPRAPGHRYLDTEGEAEAAWWATAWAELSAEARAEMAKRARRRSLSGRGRT